MRGEASSSSRSTSCSFSPRRSRDTQTGTHTYFRGAARDLADSGGRPRGDGLCIPIVFLSSIAYSSFIKDFACMSTARQRNAT